MMKKQPPTGVERLQRAREQLKAMRQAGVAGHPHYRTLLELSLSPLGGGVAGEKFAEQLDSSLARRVLIKELHDEAQPAWPDVPPDEAIMLGYEVGTDRPVVVPAGVFVRHMLVLGASGAGKTTLLVSLITQFGAKMIPVQFEDHKGEGRRLLNLRGGLK